MIPLLKTEFSIGKSIIQMGRVSESTPNKPDQPDNIHDILTEYKWDKLVLVEDNLGGFVPAYEKAKQCGASLIFGWRVSMVDSGEKKEKQPSSKVVIFVKSEEGWKKLVKIATKAQIDYYHDEARMDWKTLQEMWSDELVLAIPHYDSFIHKNLCSKDQTIPDFGNIRPYVFSEDNDIPFDGIIRKKAAEYANAYGLTLVEAKTCYYKNRADLTFFMARKLMDRKTFGSGGTIQEPNLEFFSSAEFCIEAALECDVVTEGEKKFLAEFEKPLELFMPGVRLPEFILDEEDRKFYKVPKGAKNIDVLRVLARHGYKEKMEKGEIEKSRAKEYGDRVNYELDTLEKTNFQDYILLVWMVMNYVNKNNLARGAARGSCAGSLVNYLIGITMVDPIPADLYFERFISASRAKTVTIDGIDYAGGFLPDIDCDLGASARDKVIDFLSKKYPGRFVKLGTYNTKTTKALLKDAGKVVGCMNEDQIKFFSDEIPVKFGKVASPEKAYEESVKFKDFADQNPLVFNCVKKLYGIIGNTSSHASAYLISHDTLDNFMPLQLGTDNEVITCCDAAVSEKMVIKLDLLGLQSVTLLDNVVKSLGLDISKVDYNSWDDIYVHLQNLETPSNLFQISGSAACRGLNKIMPKSLLSLSDVLAICRPGSFAFLDQYADYVNGRIEKPSLHPLFDEVLEKSGCVMLYQEQLMRMTNLIGFTLEECDTVRRIVGKKDTEKVKEWEQKIYKKAEENGIDRAAAEILWNCALNSADYLFNLCVDPNTLVDTEFRGKVKMKNVKIGERVKAFDTMKEEIHYVEVLNKHKNRKVLYDVNLEDGKTIRCSLDHKFLCEDKKMRPLSEIIKKGIGVATA